jgi:hypothetical protein
VLSRSGVEPACWQEVKETLRRSCDRIDEAHGEYDAASGHSPRYGFGRINARTAVKLATPTAA